MKLQSGGSFIKANFQHCLGTDLKMPSATFQLKIYKLYEHCVVRSVLIGKECQGSDVSNSVKCATRFLGVGWQQSFKQT